MVLPNFADLRVGVTVQEQRGGFRVLSLVPHTAIYMFGSASAGEFGSQVLTSTLNNFKNLFPGSLSEKYAENIFANDSSAELRFVRVGIADAWLVTVTAATPGSTGFTFNGTAITTTIESGDTIAETVATLINVFNQNIVTSRAATAYQGSTTDTLLIVADNFTEQITLTAPTANVTLTEQTSLTPQARDYVTALRNTFSVHGQYRQGFVIAPEAFQTLSSQGDRQKVALAMEELAAQFDFYALIDTHETVDTVAELQAERNLYNSPLGHSGFYGSYGRDLSDRWLPASAYVSALGTDILKRRGLRKSIAGLAYPLKNCKEVKPFFNDTDEKVLSDSQVNTFRNIDGAGIVIRDILTLALDSNYAQHTGRIVMNVLNGTIRGVPGLMFEVFEPIDDQGVFFSVLTQTLMSICDRLWQQGALFGLTATQAYEVVCNFSNNPNDQLIFGHVYAEVYACVVPNSRKILVNTVKVPIGQLEVLVNSGEVIA